MVVYHGTLKNDIKIFIPSTKGWLESGIYLTPNKNYTSSFANEGKNRVVMPLFLNLRNPLIITSANPIREILQELYGERAEAIYQERYNAVYNKTSKSLTLAYKTTIIPMETL